MFLYLFAGLIIWMFCCGYAGYHQRYRLFVLVVLVGMGLNALWMYFGLSASPFSREALMAQAAAGLYAVGSLGIGWFAGRLVRSFRESRVDPQ